jgi:proteasome lid subunit RPN8/RPN11
VEDDEAIQEYVSASIAFRRREMRTWEAYLDRWVIGVASHRDYLARLSKDRLSRLESAVHA